MKKQNERKRTEKDHKNENGEPTTLCGDNTTLLFTLSVNEAKI